MKIDIPSNSTFILSLENTDRLIEKYIKPRYPECKFEIRQSEQSNSIYIKIEYEGVVTTLRLSDHPPKTVVKYCYVSPHTKTQKVVGMLVGNIEKIKKVRLYQLLDMAINNHEKRP